MLERISGHVPGAGPSVIRVLLVEDDDADAERLQDILSAAEHSVFAVTRALSLGEALDDLSLNRRDIVLLDLHLPDGHGPDLLVRVRDRYPQVPVVVVADTEDSQLAQLAVGLGAQDFLIKESFDQQLITRSIRHALERHFANARLLRAAQEAESASRAKSEFLANMSHEIRTPLNTILGMADLLGGARLTERQHTYLQTLRSAGDHLLRLIDDILDLSRIESGKLELESETFQLDEFLGHTIDFFRPRARDKRIAITYQVYEDVPTFLVGDEGRLRQVLVNLLANAIKFTDAGRVHIKVQRDSDHADSGFLRISVADTGVGIPADKMEMIFEYFAQADTSTSRVYGGTGLGLAIVKRLVDAMGGQVWVESQIGHGSTFAFSTRLKAVSASELKPQPSTDANSVVGLNRPLRVLLTDDSPDSRLVVEAFLQEGGHDIDTADDGTEAVSKAANNHYDIMLMDLHMPGMDGFTAVEKIRQRESELGLAATPIVAVTADALPAAVERTRAGGFNAHLAKPISRKQLLATIGKLCNADLNAAGREIDPEIAHLLPRYLHKRRQDQHQLRSALRENDFEQISEIAHLVKGSGASYGFPELTEIASQIEESAQARNRDDIEGGLMRLAGFLDSVQDVSER